MGAATLVACAPRSAEKDLEAMRSWRASVALAQRAAHEGWAPGRYAAQVRDRAQAALNALRAAPPPDANPDDLVALAESERELQAAIDSLSAMVPR